MFNIGFTEVDLVPLANRVSDLIGQELAASRGVVAERTDADLAGGEDVASTSTGDIPDEVQHAVSEYLRKFFSATLRVRDLLDEDIRNFTRNELEAFVAAHSLDRESTAALVEVTVAGLRSNPRRVKQFVNNLELRLQLFTERKGAKHIQIEPDVLVVAKLAIIEEEWPDKYQALADDPTLLAKWHQAAAGRPVAGDPALLGSDPRFRAFLQTTYQLQPPDIRAYLTLKQTKRELAYPRCAEFAEMLEGLTSRAWRSYWPRRARLRSGTSRRSRTTLPISSRQTHGLRPQTSRAVCSKFPAWPVPTTATWWHCSDPLLQGRNSAAG